MHNPIRILKIASSLASISVFALVQANAQLPQIGVEFLGRISDPPPVSTPGVAQSDVAGVVPMAGWNTIDNQFIDPLSPNVGESNLLIDTNLNTTTVTLTYHGNDSWYNDVDPNSITTGNAKLMNGLIKSMGSDGVSESFQFNHVPEGTYDLYVYIEIDADGALADATDNDNITTYYITQWHRFFDTNVFVQAVNTNPAGPRDLGNYVKFSNLGTYGRGTIGAYVTRRGTVGNGTGVAAIELVPVGPAQVNTVPLSLKLEPIDRRGAEGGSNVTFTVQVRGPVFSGQWLQNGQPIPGATGLSYTPSPITAAMAGAKISFTASNNLNSVTTSNATLTVGQFLSGSTNVMNGGTVNITTQPADTNVIAVRSGPATFKVDATSAYTGDVSGASPPITYQWQSAPKGSSTFTDITSATNKAFTTGVLQLADDGTQFRAAVSASDATVNSRVALLTVLPNTNPPVALAGAITSNDGIIQVGVSFDEQVDPATILPANFSLSAGTISSFKVATNSFLTYASAILNTTGLTPGSSYTVTASGVKDLSGNVLPSTNLSFTVPTQVKWAESGQPVVQGQVVPVGKDGFDILNGGRQEWANYDEVTMAYVQKTNDFDVKVQVVYVEPASQWTRCGLQARNGLDVGEPWTDYTNTTTSTASEYAQTHVNGTLDLKDTGLWPSDDPNQPVNGASNNGHEQNARLSKGGATTGWGAIAADSNAPLAPGFPNVWLRLARQGNQLHGYRSADGVTWSDQGTTSLTDPQSVMYVGMSLSVESGNIWNGANNPFNVWTSPFDPKYDRLYVGEFRNFGDFGSATPGPTVTISQTGGNLTITFSGSKLQQSATLAAGSWTDVTGATSPYPVPKNAPAMFFRAVQ